jgi:hypothetical protein
MDFVESNKQHFDFGFVLDARSEGWKDTYKSIRLFYDNPILVACTVLPDIDMANTFVSLYEGWCGDLLPFYCYYMKRPFERAIFLQGSFVFTKFIEWTYHTENVHFLWHTDHEKLSGQNFINSLKHLTHAKNLMKSYSDISRWKRMFDGMCILNSDVVVKIQDDFDIFKLLPYKGMTDLLSFLLCTQTSVSSVFGLENEYFNRKNKLPIEKMN